MVGAALDAVEQPVQAHHEGGVVGVLGELFGYMVDVGVLVCGVAAEWTR